MFVRIKKTGHYNYLQVVQNFRENGKIKQRVLATLGRMEELTDNGQIDRLTQSLARHAKNIPLVLHAQSEPEANTISIGPALVFERIWEELHIPEVIYQALEGRKFGFDVERAIFLTVLHRLFQSGSDRACEQWKEDYWVEGSEQIALHQLYRAMAFLGEELEQDQEVMSLTPRCRKDWMEEKLFTRRKDLFSTLNLVFFDTTSLYFEGLGGQTLGEYGYSKDNRPDLPQMVVGAIVDQQGYPLCSEMWPGNTADITTLLPVTHRLKKRFGVENICVVADRGMISAHTIEELEKRKMSYILGVKMRNNRKIAEQVLSRAGKYKEVCFHKSSRKEASGIKVKEVWYQDKRYVVCFNEQQAEKDARDREAIIASLEDKIKSGVRQFIANKGYRKYLKIASQSITIDRQKIRQEARYDGKWILTTNTSLSAEEVALRYKELWQVEYVFRDIKNILATRPIYFKCVETIRGHVFVSFLALLLRKELDRRLLQKGYSFQWDQIKRDLQALRQIIIQQDNKKVAIRTALQGVCAHVFQSVGVAIPKVMNTLN
ncbi:MAG: IS1634 family transposase [Bacteroidales bacterium]